MPEQMAMPAVRQACNERPLLLRRREARIAAQDTAELPPCTGPARVDDNSVFMVAWLRVVCQGTI